MSVSGGAGSPTARLVLFVWLVVLWLVLWRDYTVPNLVGGFGAAGLMLVLFPVRHQGRRAHTVRPLPLARFTGHFLWQLLLANLAVAREVLRRGDRIRAGIVAVPVAGCSDLIVTVVADAITLTPGTLTLAVRHDPPTLYVHVLHLHDPERVRHDVLELQRLVVQAIGPPAPAGGCGASPVGGVGNDREDRG